MRATFSKLRDDTWGIRVEHPEGEAPEAGARVQVETKAGKRMPVQLGLHEATFDVQGGQASLYRKVAGKGGNGNGAQRTPAQNGHTQDRDYGAREQDAALDEMPDGFAALITGRCVRLEARIDKMGRWARDTVEPNQGSHERLIGQLTMRVEELEEVVKRLATRIETPNHEAALEAPDKDLPF